MAVRKTARFTVDSERFEEALDVIRAFVAHTETEPGTLLYQSWQSAARPTRFLHIMEFADDDAEKAHATSDAVKAFTGALYPLCTEPPFFEDWGLVSG